MNGAVRRHLGARLLAFRVAASTWLRAGERRLLPDVLKAVLKCQEMMEKHKENNPESSIRNIDNPGKSLLWTFFDYIICSFFLTKCCYHTSIIKQEYINGRN